MLEQLFGPFRGIILLIIMFGGVFLFNLALKKSDVLSGLCVILIGVGAGWSSYQFGYEARMLNGPTHTVTATISEMEITRARRGYSYRIYLDYISPIDGSQQTERSTLSKELYEVTNVGDTIDLMVAVEDPEIVTQVRHYPPSRTPMFISMFMCIFFVGGGLSILLL